MSSGEPVEATLCSVISDPELLEIMPSCSDMPDFIVTILLVTDAMLAVPSNEVNLSLTAFADGYCVFVLDESNDVTLLDEDSLVLNVCSIFSNFSSTEIPSFISTAVERVSGKIGFECLSFSFTILAIIIFDILMMYSNIIIKNILTYLYIIYIMTLSFNFIVMNNDTYNTEDILKLFKNKYKNSEFRGNTVELQNIHFVCDKDYIIREPNYDYVKREIKWYESQSLNVNDIPESVPKIWKQVATPLGYINSNYGWCIFSKDNGNQYECCLKSLLRNYLTRQAVMIYTRPQMQADWNKNGMTDFMCTHYVHCFLNEVKHPENNVEVYELKYIVYQRSCDAVFGFNNDLQWHKYVYNKLYDDLIKAGIPMSEHKPYIEYNCGSLHVYDRHFKYLEN